MLIIRLSRIGKKKHPTFRIIVSEKTKDTKGDYLELLGSYNPHTNEAKIKAERVKYWLSKGAKMSATINNLFINKKVIEGKKVKVFKPKKQATTEPQKTQKVAEATEKKKEPKSDVKQATAENVEIKKPTEPQKTQKVAEDTEKIGAKEVKKSTESTKPTEPQKTQKK